MDANEQSVDDEVHEGEDNAVNMEVIKEYNEMNQLNEMKRM